MTAPHDQTGGPASLPPRLPPRPAGDLDRMTDPLPSVAVIIPVYDTGLYVLDALDSVLGQTAPPAEILLVDDASGPATAALLDRAAARRPDLIRVLRHPENRGLAAARNTGIRAARADLLLLLDSDDALADPAVIADVARQAAATGFDMMRLRLRFWREDPVSGAERFWEDANDGFIPADLTGVNAAMVPALYQSRANWQFAYRRGFLAENALMFDEELRRREDRPFLVGALLRARRIDLSSRIGFHYRQRPGSIMHDPQVADLTHLARGVELARGRIRDAGEAQGPARFIFDIHYLTGLQGLLAPFLKAGEEEAVREALARLCAALCADLPADHPGPGPEAAGFFAAWPARGRQSRFPPAAQAALENGWLGTLHAAMLDGPEAALDLVWASTGMSREALARPGADIARAARAARMAEDAARTPPAAPRAARGKLLLHIGLTKTGSTSLQSFFELNRARLLDRGACYPEAGIYREPGTDRGSGHNMGLREVFRDGPRETFEAMIAEIGAAPLGILSCENLSWNADWRSPAGVAALARALEGFDVTVLLVVRDEFDWLVSMYKEAVAGGWLRWGEDPMRFLRTQEALGGTDFRGVLDGFAAGFGAANCRMIDVKGEGELGRRALAVVDPALAEDPGLLSPPRANIGVGDAQAAALRLLNRLPSEGAAERAFFAMARENPPAVDDAAPRIEAMLAEVETMREASGRTPWDAAARARAAERLAALWGSEDLRRATELLTERQRWARRPAEAAETPKAETRPERAAPLPLTPIEAMLDHAAGEEERRLRRFGAPRPYAMTLSCDPEAGIATLAAPEPLEAVRLSWDALDRPDSLEEGEWTALEPPAREVAIPLPRRRFLSHARLVVQARAGRRHFRRELCLAVQDGAPFALAVGGEPGPAETDATDAPRATARLRRVSPPARDAATG